MKDYAPHMIATLMSVGILTVSIVANSPHYPDGVLPPKDWGVVNALILPSTLCSETFRTDTLRPSTSYTTPIKIKLLLARGETKDRASYYELDHLLPIYDGGDPKDPHNLWLQPWHVNYKGFDLGAKAKDRLEVVMHKYICDGSMLPEQVLFEMRNWPEAYKKYIGPWPTYFVGLTGIDVNDEEEI